MWRIKQSATLLLRIEDIVSGIGALGTQFFWGGEAVCVCICIYMRFGVFLLGGVGAGHLLLRIDDIVSGIGALRSDLGGHGCDRYTHICVYEDSTANKIYLRV